MELHDIIFTPIQIANMCGTTKQTITRYCRMGILKSDQDPHSKHHKIYGDDLCRFLYQHPSFYAAALKNTHGVNSILVIKKLKNCPKIYTFYELMDIFQVSKSTILNWIKNGYLIPYSYERGNKTNPIFHRRDVRILIEKLPRLRKFYTDYIRRVK